MAIIDDFAAIKSGLPSAEPTLPAGDDDAIVRKFREWIAAAAVCDHLKPKGDDDLEWEARIDALDAMAAQIAEMPSSGAGGLAIKVFFAVRCDIDRTGIPGRQACLRGFGPRELKFLTTPIIAAVVRDAVRFVPELSELCAAIAEPLP